MNPLMNSVGSNAEGKLNCINAVVITHLITHVLIQSMSDFFMFTDRKSRKKWVSAIILGKKPHYAR